MNKKACIASFAIWICVLAAGVANSEEPPRAPSGELTCQQSQDNGPPTSRDPRSIIFCELADDPQPVGLSMRSAYDLPVARSLGPPFRPVATTARFIESPHRMRPGTRAASPTP